MISFSLSITAMVILQHVKTVMEKQKEFVSYVLQNLSGQAQKNYAQRGAGENIVHKLLRIA